MPGPALRSAGAELDERRVREGDPLPELGEVDGIVSLGGEQNALDPALAAEAELLREAVARGVPVLGVCLGAQLLAHALGGTVRTLERRHLDWIELHALPAAAGDPVLGALPPGAHGVHWNEDGFDLPPGAVELLRSPAGSGEGFRAGERAWGVSHRGGERAASHRRKHPIRARRRVGTQGCDGVRRAGCLCAKAPAAVRVPTSSLARMLLTCRSTVRWLSTSCSAISLFELPTATSRSTSSSRGVRPPGRLPRIELSRAVTRSRSGAAPSSANPSRAAASSNPAESSSPRSRQALPSSVRTRASSYGASASCQAWQDWRRATSAASASPSASATAPRA